MAPILPSGTVRGTPRQGGTVRESIDNATGGEKNVSSRNRLKRNWFGASKYMIACYFSVQQHSDTMP